MFLDAFRKSLATYVLALLSTIIAYRLSPWHPLARYPGPFLYRATNLILTAWEASGFRNQHVRSLHERYGDVIRVGEPSSGCNIAVVR